MAKDELTGNMATENIVRYLEDNKVPLNIDKDKLAEVLLSTAKVFEQHHSGL